MKKIKLTRGKYALVDDEDFEYLSQWSWFYNGGYAKRFSTKADGIDWRKRKMISMASVVANTPEGLVADHRNRVKLDNRKENLRNCTIAENNMNRGFKLPYRGVFWNKRDSLYQAKIYIKGKLTSVGTFKDEIHAALAYDIAAKDVGGLQRNFADCEVSNSSEKQSLVS